MSQNYKAHPDYILLFVVVALLSVGLLMVFSASPTMAMSSGDSYYFLKRHFLALLVGFAAIYAGMKIDHAVLKHSATYVFGASIFLLLLVFLPGIGVMIRGGSRWLDLGLFSFQPGELAKLALIIFLASELSQKTLEQAIVPSITATLVAGLLIIRQPDLGTALIIGAVAMIMLFLAGTPFKYLISAGSAALVAVLLLSLAKPYRFRRLMAYLNPNSDPTGIGYHINQSLIAIGSGGLFGLGLGQSKQKFYYLPQNYTDFIFAIFCEEMGLIGALIVVLLFFVFISRGLRAVANSPDAFSFLLSGGIVAWIGFQALLNMSVVLGLLPTTGIPLPFISYGGTSIVVSLFATGLLLNISCFRKVQS